MGEGGDVIREGRETHFDPDVLDAFLEIHEEFRAIAGRFADRDGAHGTADKA